MSRSSLFRLAFLAVWFFLVPTALAYGTVHVLQGVEPVEPIGVIGTITGFVRDQPIPAGIVLFTLFEMTLYSFRHQLPLAERLSIGGREGLPARIRRDYEAATHLVDESERILAKRQKAFERDVPARDRKELLAALEQLKAALKTDPLDEEAFSEAYERAADLSRHLDPWRKGELREYVESIGVAILVALLLRAVVVEAFKIPSGSMLPTLQINDHIFVNKFTYGPKIPILDTRIFSDMPPERGDVIVFEFPDPDPNSERQDFIKRVIGLPGDVLEVDGGHPIINGWRVPNCRVGNYPFAEPSEFGEAKSGDLYVEYLGERAYLTLFEAGWFDRHQGPYRVAPGEVWVFGDNRNNSSDSRAWFGGRGGGVPYANIKGRAMFVWLPPSRLFVDVMGKPVLPKGAPQELVQGIAKCLSKRPPFSETSPPPPNG